MTTEMIRVEPALDRRECFARWAVAQTPKVRTADHNAFAVPADLFTEAPEGILIGALVDGRLYIPVEDGGEGPGRDDDGLAWAEPGQSLPPVPESAYGPDSVPLEDALTGDDEENRDSRDPATEEPARSDGTYTVLLTDADSDSSDQEWNITPGGSDLPTPEPGPDTGGEPKAEGVFPCPGCDREFTTQRGSDMHYRVVHSKES